MKILSVFGTRPEAIKMAPVVRELRKREASVTSLVCVTGQHRQMLDQALKLFSIHPDYDLDLMRTDQTLAELTAQTLVRLDAVLQEEKPDWVLVQGDTTTAMAAAMAAFYRRIRVGHIEAGLRTWNRNHPFPEEINRKFADAVSDLHFAPTEQARRNLLHEGFNEASVKVTGNTVIDALLDVASRPYEWNAGPLAAAPHDRRILLVTAHRRENFGRPLENICDALIALADRYEDLEIIYPVHLNPNVYFPVHRRLGGVKNITLLEPLDYLPMVQLLKGSYLVLTDSGGLQEEAPSLGIPVLVLREATERPEGVEAGTVKVIGTVTDDITRETCKLLNSPEEYQKMSRSTNPYGDGRAAQRIVQAVFQADTA